MGAHFSLFRNPERSKGSYRYGYQGLYSEEDEKTSWHSFELRQYDSDIGRWNSIDPYGQYHSPYVAMGNAPNMRVDANGGWSGGPIGSKISFVKNVVDWARVGKFALNYALPAAASVGRSYEGLNNLKQQNATLVQPVQVDQNGECCGKDWFGKTGEFFEKNYNGGIVYDGNAWYGTNFVGPGPSINPYKLKDAKNPGQYLKPKDMVDAAAQRHDYYYYMLHADGIKGALFNTNVTFADQILANEAYSAFIGYFKGDIDPITGRAISPRTRDVAFDVLVSFGLISGAKLKIP